MKTTFKWYLLLTLILMVLDSGSTYYALGTYPHIFYEVHPISIRFIDLYGLGGGLLIGSLFGFGILFMSTLIIDKALKSMGAKGYNTKVFFISALTGLSIGLCVKAYVVVHNFSLLYKLLF